MSTYGYLVVEGPQDVEFAYRLLKPFGLGRIQHFSKLKPFWVDLVPTKYPPDDDLQKRVPVPLFLQSKTHSIAIHSAGGDSRIAATIEETAAIIRVEKVTGIGVILDSDSEFTPAVRHDRVKKEMESIQSREFTLPNTPGDVGVGVPRLGIYVLPDNRTLGTLEDLLLECGRDVYPELLRSAEAHVHNAASDKSLIEADMREFSRSSGRKKAIVGAIASILRPGRAVQNSIQDNRWLQAESLSIPRVKAVQDFLARLFDL